MVHRFERSKFLFSSQDVSKNSLTLVLKSTTPKVRGLVVDGGLFKINALEMQHILIFLNIVGKAPRVDRQVHGKKKKHTLSLSARLSGSNISFALDKLVNELLPKTFDFKTTRIRRAKKKKYFNYTFKLINRYSPLPDFAQLVDPDMYAKNKGLFLPLAYSFGVNLGKVKDLEDYFRKLQLPFNFFKKRFKAAFDDKEDFSMLVYEYIEPKKKKNG
jgi:hypothetical protein